MKVGGFFRFRHRAKFTSARLAEMKKAKRCGAADGFLYLFSWVQGLQSSILSSIGEKSKVFPDFQLFYYWKLEHSNQVYPTLQHIVI